MKPWSNSNVAGGNGSVPEKRLLAAVLQRAVADYIGGESELKLDAYSWLMDDENTSSDDDCEDPPLTFKFICEALDLDSDNLRRAIRSQAENSVGAGTFVAEMAI